MACQRRSQETYFWWRTLLQKLTAKYLNYCCKALHLDIRMGPDNTSAYIWVFCGTFENRFVIFIHNEISRFLKKIILKEKLNCIPQEKALIHKSNEMFCAIWYHRKMKKRKIENVKSTHRGVLLLATLLAEACYFNLYICYPYVLR